jgi:hypothetical protein
VAHPRRRDPYGYLSRSWPIDIDLADPHWLAGIGEDNRAHLGSFVLHLPAAWQIRSMKAMVGTQTVQAGAVRLAYAVSGESGAPPMVLLHALGQRAADWQPVAR